MKKQRLIPVLLAALLGIGGVALATESHDHGAAHPATTETIAATGTVKSVDAAAGKLVIDHDPIPALKWPRMVMDFRLADKAMAGRVKAGDKVRFTLTPGEKGSYIVIAIEPVR
jgi:Cu/Ag efflux protein CusF